MADMVGYGSSGLDHDFFAYNSAGDVWNGAAFVTWSDVDFASYRITATEQGTSGRFKASPPADAVSYELREQAMVADQILVLPQIKCAQLVHGLGGARNPRS